MTAHPPDQETSRLLSHLARGGAWSYLYFLPNKTATWRPAGAPVFIPQVSQNIYFGVHPTAARKRSNERATVADVCAVNALYGEFDQKDGATLRQIEAQQVRPSVCIASGGGWHVYWLFQQPVAVNDANRARLAAIQKRWVAYVGADSSAADLARVLRLPETWNLKYTPPRPVNFVWSDFTALYDLDELAARLPKEQTRPAPAAREYDAPPQDDPEFWLSRALEEARRTNKRNEAGFWLSCQLRDARIGRLQAESVLRRYQEIVTGWKDQPYTRQEALNSLDAAYAKPARDPAKKLYLARITL